MAFCSGIFNDQDIEILKDKPRTNFTSAIKKMDATSCLIKTAEIHGHFCPGSALGVMASLYGLSLLENEVIESDGIMENLLAIVEVNACFADGIQAVSGCTLGNNSLIYRDLGKHAVTFAIRGKEKGVRVKVLPEFKEYIEDSVPEFYPLMEKVIVKRQGSSEDEKKFKETAREAAFSMTKIPFDKLFSVETTVPDIPDYAPITDSVICPECGEVVMASKVCKSGLKKGMCFMCSGHYSEVEGKGIVEKSSVIIKGNDC
ncbi:formylmethanofuran dehydrogenase [Methanolobus vulcani]|uniref:Formylmethanofuran dehydrogenase n=2 Tax=Methanolobus vulcani TaxID=38026 RepID=A0A7Z8KQC5_9EURY|nr:formylmethanofuran dehydrogenase [Methanolobus vulcani]